jgi:hypothetical protein
LLTSFPAPKGVANIVIATLRICYEIAYRVESLEDAAEVVVEPGCPIFLPSAAGLKLTKGLVGVFHGNRNSECTYHLQSVEA